MTPDRRLIESEHAVVRVGAAARWIAARRGEPGLVIAARREAADVLVRRVVDEAGPCLGWRRTTIDGVAGALAARELARRGLTPATGMAIEALCARLVGRMGRELGRFAALADRPGLPRALAATLSELAHADLGPAEVAEAAPDLARIHAAYRAELPACGLADRATVLEIAARAVSDGASHPLLDRPLCALDVRIRSRLEADLVAAIAARAPAVLVTVPRGDDRARALVCERIELVVADLASRDLAGGDLAGGDLAGGDLAVGDLAGGLDPAVGALQSRLFSEVAGPSIPEKRGATEAVEIFSAPGESRESVEIARRILEEARRGTRFDRIAIALRAPEVYRVHLAEALRRAGVPASVSRGARRPDRAGRAFLALLACAAEGLSARAFGEYLSLVVVPDDEDGAPPRARSARDRFVPADEELASLEEDGAEETEEGSEAEVYDEDAPVRAGTLRAPRRWEQLIVDAAVIGGRDRWQRRLEGLERATRIALAEEEDRDGARARALERRLGDLASLRRFALPLIDALAALPARASWGEWIDALGALATRALRAPRRVLASLASLAPMAEVGPIDLAEVRAVLTPRLREEPAPPPREEVEGRVLVCAIDEIRGRELDVVFVPGLAEKILPAKIVEDPILLDAVRERIGGGLETRRERGHEERLLLRIAIGAARRRVVASIPRIDADRARPRVPSFYALEIVRATEGTLPSYEALVQRAEIAGRARLGWPAPPSPASAIDAAEHDLAVLGDLLARPPAERVGGAAYLLGTSAIAARALRTRWARWDRKRWRPQDGMVDPDEAVRAILAEHTLDRRPYSATALESYASCPYRFYLRTIVRLEPRETPEPLEQLDAAQRGTLVHAAQFRLLVRLREEGALPVRAGSLDRALAALDEIVAEVARHYEEELAPAIRSVWEDTLESVRRDLREWLHRVSDDPTWTPARFELAFGIPAGEERDAASRAEPVPLSIGVTLRGAIDLVEERVEPDGRTLLRATDHKTGSAWVKAGQRIAGGEKLQPLLYALALEALFPEAETWGGRLFYCTEKGRYTTVDVPLDTEGRAAIATVAATIDEAVRSGFLPPAPTERVCGFCDYAPVCGPSELRRSKRKEGDRLVALDSLRRMP